MDELTIFRNRLLKIGIDTTYFANYPWVYLDSICGKKVKEKFASEHYFTVGYMNKGFEFENLTEIFNLIRKYRNERTD